MKLTAILDIALAVFLVILIIAAIWFVIELARVIRRANKTLDEVNQSIEPLVSNVNVILENAQPAVARIDPLIEHATLTVDALNLEIMRLDPVIEDLGDAVGSLSGAIDGISNAPSKLASSIHDRLDGISLPGKEKAASVIANVRDKVAGRGVEPEVEFKSYTTVGVKAAPASAKADVQDECAKRAAHAKDEAADAFEAIAVDAAVAADAIDAADADAADFSFEAIEEKAVEAAEAIEEKATAFAEAIDEKVDAELTDIAEAVEAIKA